MNNVKVLHQILIGSRLYHHNLNIQLFFQSFLKKLLVCLSELVSDVCLSQIVFCVTKVLSLKMMKLAFTNKIYTFSHFLARGSLKIQIMVNEFHFNYF